jgi:hypothetical protein
VYLAWAFYELGGLGPVTGFHPARDHVNALLLQAVAFQEHLPGLADPGAVARIDLELAALGPADEAQEAEGFIIIGPGRLSAASPGPGYGSLGGQEWGRIGEERL